MRKINIGLVGCGRRGRLYSELSSQIPEVVYAEGGDMTHKGSGMIDNMVGTIRFHNGIVASVVQGDGGLNNFTSKFFIELFAEDKGATLYNRCHGVMFWG